VVQAALACLLHPAPGQILTKVFGEKSKYFHLSLYLHCFKRVVLTAAS
jgi:hypothetical protein